MKLVLALFFLFNLSAYAQTPPSYITTFESKIYSLKSKGVKDFVVDISSSQLTRQMNEQKIFGKVNELIFRTYWTSSPERLAVEVIGLPEGFKEVKEGLKLSILGMMDNLLPVSIQQKFAGYKIVASSIPKEFKAIDQTGIAPIPAYVLKFDAEDKLKEIIGHKPVGNYLVELEYDKKSFSDNKWLLLSEVIQSSGNGQTVTSSKELKYGEAQGMGVLVKVEFSTEQKWDKADIRPIEVEEEVEFKNYKINSGEAMKYFLGEIPKK